MIWEVGTCVKKFWLLSNYRKVGAGHGWVASHYCFSNLVRSVNSVEILYNPKPKPNIQLFLSWTRDRPLSTFKAARGPLGRAGTVKQIGWPESLGNPNFGMFNSFFIFYFLFHSACTTVLWFVQYPRYACLRWTCLYNYQKKLIQQILNIFS